MPPAERIFGPAPRRPRPSRPTSVGGRQPRAFIGDEHRKDSCGLGGAGALANEMMRARRLEEAFAGAVRVLLATLDLRAQGPGQDIDEDGAGVTMGGAVNA